MPRYFQNMPTVGKAVRANPENVAPRERGGTQGH